MSNDAGSTTPTSDLVGALTTPPTPPPAGTTLQPDQVVNPQGAVVQLGEQPPTRPVFKPRPPISTVRRTPPPFRRK